MGGGWNKQKNILVGANTENFAQQTKAQSGLKKKERWEQNPTGKLLQSEPSHRHHPGKFAGTGKKKVL